MAKINLDKYYTSTELAEYCVNKTKDVIGENNIVEYLEPSAGGGSFLEFLGDNYLAYDIEPTSPNIITKDYLALELEYLKGRCIIGNPPYGEKNQLSVKFYKKAITQGDYISFILPISQYKNNMYMYEFDLVYSEDLGIHLFSGIEVHVVLNIYKRNKKGYNKKPKYDLEDVVLKGVARGASRNDKVPDVYDFSICAYGASIGKVCDYDNQYCQQTYITIKNNEYISDIIDLIIKADWCKLYGMDLPNKKKKLNHWMIYKYLKDNLPLLK